MPTAERRPQPATSRVRVLSSFGSSGAQPEEFPVEADTTAADLARLVLARHGMSTRDPRLFYFTLDSGGGGGLPDEARLLPRLLPSNGNAGKPSLLVMHMRSGGLVKIHDAACLMPGGYCKSLFVSRRTTASQVLQLLLDSYGMKAVERAEFVLTERDAEGRELRQLDPDDCPLAIQQARKDLAIHLKRRRPADDADEALRQPPTQPPLSARTPTAVARVEPAPQTPQQERRAGGTSETLARLRDSFRDLQRLRSENPELYERTLLTRPTEPAEAAAASELRARLRGGGLGGGDSMSRRRGAARRLQRLEGADVPMSARDAPRSARYTGIAAAKRSAEAEEASAGVGTPFRRQVGDDSSSTARGSVRSVRSARSDFAQRVRRTAAHEASPPATPTPSMVTPTTALTPTTPTLTSSTSRRLLPRLPAAGPDELMARRARAELAAQRQLTVSRRDFQCQAALDAEPGATSSSRSVGSVNAWQPTLAELLSVCNLVCRRLHRRSFAHAWGIRCYTAQLFLPVDGEGDSVNVDAETNGGPVGRRPAIGMANGDLSSKRSSGVFRANPRLLERLRRLTAVDSVAEDGAVGGADSGLRSGDLLVEVNGASALGASPKTVERMLERHRTLHVLVARPRAGRIRDSDADSLDEESLAAATSAAALTSSASSMADSVNSDTAGGLRLQLRRLRLRCQELAERASGFERQAEQLRSLLARRARVSVLESATTGTIGSSSHRQLPSTGQSAAPALDSPASRASFRVIREQQRPDEVTSTV